MDKQLKSNTIKNPVTKAYFKISEEASKSKNICVNEEETLYYNIGIKNNLEVDRSNVTIKQKLPEGVTYKESKIAKKEEKMQYNEQTRELSVTLEKLLANETVNIQIQVVANKLLENEYEKEIIAVTTAEEGEHKVSSSGLINYIGKPKIETEVNYVNSKKDIYEGDIVEIAIKVTNVGDLPGNASSIMVYKNQLQFNSGINTVWYQGTDGNYYTSSLERITINPGETKEIKILLIKNLNSNNTGNIETKVAIAKTYNDKNLEDNDKQNNENKAECIIMVATGEKVINIVIILAGLIILIVIIILVKKKEP